MTREELAAHPSYPELLARFLQLEQRVNDLAAQLAQHEASTLAHNSLRPLGLAVLDGLSAAYDYDVTAQTDGPLLVDDALTDEQRDRIWRRVQDATAPEYTVYRPDEVQP